MTRRVLKAIRITEIASVDRPAHGEGARQVLMKREDDAPLLKMLAPKPGESEADFMARCMADPKMKADCPDAKDRSAAAAKAWHAGMAKYNQNHGAGGLFSSGDGGGGAGTRHTKDGGARRSTEEPAHVNTTAHVGNAYAATAGSQRDAAAHKNIGYAKEALARGDAAHANDYLERARFALTPSHPAHADITASLDEIHRAADAKTANDAAHQATGEHPFKGSDKSPDQLARLYEAHVRKSADTNTNQDASPAGAPGESETDAGQEAAEGIGEGNTMSDTKIAAAELPTDKLKAAETKVEELTKQLAVAARFAELSDAEKSFSKALANDAERIAFLSGTPEERAARLAKAKDANPVVFTAADGTEFRKSDDPRHTKLARQSDELAKALADERMEKRTMLLTKQAESDLRYLPGDVGTKVDLLKAIESLPEAARVACLATLKAQNADMSKAFVKVGTTSQPSNGVSKLDQMAKALAKEKSISESAALLEIMRSGDNQRLVTEEVR